MRALDIREIVDEILRRKIQLILIIVLFIIFGFAYTMNFVKPEFKSTAKVILTNTTIENNSFNFEISSEIINSKPSTDSNLFSTYINLIKSNSVMEKVKTNIKIDLNINDLINSVSVNRIENTEMIEISVKNTDSNLASNIANEIAKVFSENIKELYDINAYLIEKAVPNEVAYNSDNVKIEHLKNIIAFMIIGLIIDILYVILVIKIDTKIKSEDDIEKDIGLKVLMSIPTVNEKNKKQIELITNNQKTIFSDVFKKLRINIQFTNINHRENKVILVTSAFSSEGKSFITSNLAISFAQAGKKVILVDTDMRIDRLSKVFNIPSELGLSNYLSNLDTEGMETNQRINSYIKETSIKNLNIITSGSIPPNPSELLETRKISDLIKELSVFYDLIILDGAPALPVSDSLMLARLANSTLVVCSYNKTKKEELSKVKKDIQSVGGRLVGVVLNRVKLRDYELNYSIVVEEKRKKERKLFRKNILKKRFVAIKEKIINILKNMRKEEVKLLMSKQDSTDIKTSIKKENNLPNYQISEEYIKENIKNNSKDNITETNNNQSKKEEEKKKIEELKEKERIEKEKKQEELAKIKEVEILAKKEQEQKLAEEKEKRKLEKEEKREEKIKLANERKEKFNELKQEKLQKFIEFKNEKTEKASIFLKEKSSIAKESFKKLIEKTNKTKENLKEKILKLRQIQKEKSALKKEQNEIEKQKLEELKKQEAIEREKENKILEEIREKERIENAKKQEELAKIKEAEMIAKREQEQKLAEEREKLRQEKEKLRYEEKIRKQALRAELKNKRMYEREEKRKEREERRLKQKEEARIKEELLEDNLYPKTKYNKNL